MIGRKALTGLSLLCALVFCAFAAPSAFALGTTAYTCVPVTPKTGDFGDAHCDNTKVQGNFEHETLAANPTPEVTGTNESTKSETKEATAAVLMTTAAGLETVIECATVHSVETIENSFPSELHTIKVSNLLVEYSNCTVPKPAGQHCKVVEPIKTEKLTAETVVAEPMGLKFTPASGTRFVTITFKECQTAGLNKGYEVTGSVSSKPSGSDFPDSAGATVVIEQPKSGSSLEFGGQKAGLTQVETIKMKEGNPIATTATP